MFEFLFGHSRRTFENGELLSAAPWPLWMLLTAASLAALLIIGSLYWRRRSLSGWRLAVVGALQLGMVAVVAIMFWQPVLQVETVRPGENRVVVLLDSSASMRYGDGGQTRMQEVLAALDEQLLTRLGDVADIELVAFSQSPQPLESLDTLPPPGEATRLTDALENVLLGARQSPLGAVVVISDGSDTTGTADAAWLERLRGFATPVHTVGVGREQLADETELSEVILPSQMAPETGQLARLRIDSGRDGPAEVKVYNGDRIVAAGELQLQAGSAIYTVPFNSGEAGVYDLRFVLEPGEGESDTINNVQERVVQVSETPRRVLYFEGEPRWEYKFLRRAVEFDNSVALVSLLRTSPNKFYRQGIESAEELEEGFPLDRETLFDYDALIIGSIEAATLQPDQLLNIKQFVSERGGSLLMLGGQRGLNQGGWGVTPVADVLPVMLADPESPTFLRERAPVALTRSGALSPLLQLDADASRNSELWASLPELADFQQVGTPKPGAEVLLEVEREGVTQPLLVTQRYGRGFAAVLATGGTWRWQMQLPSTDLTHEQFWSRLLKELVANSPSRVALRADRDLYADESEVGFEVELRDELYEPVTGAALTALAIAPDGTSLPVPLTPIENRPGQYRGEFAAVQAGDWRIELDAADGDTELGSASQYISRRDGLAEHFGIAQNRALLESIASTTGGDYWPLAQIDALPEALQFNSAGVRERQIHPLWYVPALFLALLMLKCLEWGLRLHWRRL